MTLNGLYVHIPFCIRKCPYCDFLSFPGAERGDFSHYAALAARQMKVWRDEDLHVDTIFFGGGTPTLLGAKNLTRILDAARENFNVEQNAEITLEANPGTVDFPMLRALKNAGFNRISFGVQSFCDETLRRIGRIHSASEAIDAVHMAQDAGIARVSVDLISALPHQTLREIEENAETAASLGVTHVSCYDLTIAQDTPFGTLAAQGNLPLPDEDTSLLMQQRVCEILNAAGFERYEISNYAKDGAVARHNLHYWHNDDYIGVGCGAHGRFRNMRYVQAETLAEYESDVQAGQRWHECEEMISTFDDAAETLMLGMRLKEGVDFSALLSRLPEDTVKMWERLSQKYESLGLVTLKNGRLCPTPRGWEVQNAWLSTFL